MNARTATAAQFEERAQMWANRFWLAIGGVLWWFGAGWLWVTLLAVVAVFAVAGSITCTRGAAKLRAGTYRTPNPNNGAPDGDASNWTA